MSTEKSDAHPEQNGGLDQMLGLDDSEERSVLNQTLGRMPQVHVPSDFVPTVMSRIYVNHARSQVKVLHAVVVTLLLSLLGVVFFIWDVSNFKAESGAATMGEAYGRRFQLALQEFERAFSTFAELLGAAWQIVSATFGYLRTSGDLIWVVLLFGAFIGLLYGVRKWLSSR